MGREEPHEVQKREVENPVPGEEQPQALVHAGATQLEKKRTQVSWWTQSWS